MDREMRGFSLKWKIGGIFTVVLLLLSLAAIGAVYQVARNIVTEQLDKRAAATAMNLSDAAAGYVVGHDPLALHALARKYTLLEGVAYALVRDGKGEIVAHTLGGVPEEIARAGAFIPPGQIHRRQTELEGKTVYETSVPVLEGQAGTASVGFWADAAEAEIRRALVPLIGILAVLPVAGALLAFLVAHWLVRPIVGLTEVADRVTMGDLETSVSTRCIRSRDEIGDLARSLERMRSSLKAAMLRLGREAA